MTITSEDQRGSVSNADAATSALMQQLAMRGTVRDFRPDPIPQTMANAIAAHGMRAPTSSNRQEYSIIQIDNPATRQTISDLSSNQKHIVECPLFFAVCADQNRMEHALGMYGKDYPATGLEGGLVATIDAAFVGLTMSYVADSLGLASVMIGAMRNNPVKIAKLLGLPPRCYAVFGLCIGWPATPALAKPRHDLGAVLHHEMYSKAAHDEAIKDYDSDLAAYYRKRGVETIDTAWSEVMSQKFAAPSRTKLREELALLGFPFA